MQQTQQARLNMNTLRVIWLRFAVFGALLTALLQARAADNDFSDIDGTYIYAQGNVIVELTLSKVSDFVSYYALKDGKWKYLGQDGSADGSHREIKDGKLLISGNTFVLQRSGDSTGNHSEQLVQVKDLGGGVSSFIHLPTPRPFLKVCPR